MSVSESPAGPQGAHPAPERKGRVAAVRRLESTAVGSPALQRLAGLAARLLGTESARISLLGDVETVVGGAGLPAGAVGGHIPLDRSLCSVTLGNAAEPVIIANAGADPRTAGLAAVATGRVGGYLGMPLLGPDGAVGALCVFGPEPRDWADADVALLRQLAESVATELELSALAKEFEASRLRFDLAIDAAGIGSFDYDLLTGELTWDDRLIELFGYDRETFEGTIDAFFSRLHPDDLARTQDAMQASIDARGPLDVEYRIVLPTGETRWVQGRGRVLAGDGGTAVRMLGAAYDTTQQRHGDARVARVLESMSAAFYSLDREWRFSYVNAEAERLVGRAREEVLGRNVWELYPAAVGSVFETEFRTAVATGETRVFEAYYPAPLDGWYELRVWPSPDGLSVYFLDVTERRAAQERARASAARLALVAGVSALLSANLGSAVREGAASRQVAEALVPELGDWSVVVLFEDDGLVRDVAAWHREPASRPVVARYLELRLSSYQSTPELNQALASGQVVVVPDVGEMAARSIPDGEARELFDRLAPRSAAMLPLTARGRVLGAVTLYSGADRPPMEPEDVAAAREVADRVALALDNSRLYEQQRRIAEGLQRSLLTAPPQPNHAEIVVRYRPAMEAAQVGGDWYDAFVQPSGATVLVIGDVVGHDTEAAAAMGQLRGMLRGIGYRDGVTPAEILRELDAAIHGLGMGTMATAAIARVEQTPEERAAGLTRLRWSNAGHPPPLLLHHDGRIEELAGEQAELMLGVDPSATRTDSVVTVHRGSTLLLYTDGLVEGRELPLDEGTARLRSVLAELAAEPLGDLCDAVIERLQPEGLQDDVALVAIRLHPEDRPRPAGAGPQRVPPATGGG